MITLGSVSSSVEIPSRLLRPVSLYAGAVLTPHDLEASDALTGSAWEASGRCRARAVISTQLRYVQGSVRIIGQVVEWTLD